MGRGSLKIIPPALERMGRCPHISIIEEFQKRPHALLIFLTRNPPNRGIAFGNIPTSILLALRSRMGNRRRGNARPSIELVTLFQTRYPQRCPRPMEGI